MGENAGKKEQEALVRLKNRLSIKWETEITGTTGSCGQFLT